MMIIEDVVHVSGLVVAKTTGKRLFISLWRVPYFTLCAFFLLQVYNYLMLPEWVHFDLFYL